MVKALCLSRGKEDCVKNDGDLKTRDKFRKHKQRASVVFISYIKLTHHGFGFFICFMMYIALALTLHICSDGLAPLQINNLD